MTKLNQGAAPISSPPPSWHRAAYSIDAMRGLAQRALPRPIFDFADGGTENEYTLRRNEAAFYQVEFLPQPLKGVTDRDLSIELFGRRLSLPIVIGPTGLSGLFWPDGEIAAARAAAAAGIGFCLSHGSTCSIEEMAATSVSPRWMQVFVYRDRGFTREFVERAAAAGFDALVLTTDTQLIVNRERDIRNGFTIPPRFSAADVASMAGKLPWLRRMGPRLAKISFANYASLGAKADIGSLAAKLPGMLDPSMSWKDVEWLRGLWKGPFLLKGIMHPNEATEAVARGVDAVIVSNHGGRQLNGMPASLDAVPGVVRAVDGRIPVLLDGGIRRGADIVKARALGVAACLIARPHLFGLAVAGEAGVARVLDVFRREIDRTLGLLGVSSLAEVTSDYLMRRDASDYWTALRAASP